ncbi:protein methyltransferase [Gigaspora rosea]|uniref:Protein arginine N-methyltransferase n=1 Tax=Gigaspora rosea TaxID=44941 RepID=A0A397VNU0_9GLOM|nr:protein methyltransferase [Gigaspora rosea]
MEASTTSNPNTSNFPRIMVGLSRGQEEPDASLAAAEARELGYDFMILPITFPSYRRFLFEQLVDSVDIKETKFMEEWRKGQPFCREDLIVKNADVSDFMVGQVSNWINLDSLDHNIRINSEVIMRQQITWIGHVGITAVLIPSPSDSLMNYARCVNNIFGTVPYINLWIKIPLVLEDEILESNETVTWERWNKFRTLCENHVRLSIALEVTQNLPEDNILDRWFAEPIRAVILPTNLFLSNAKGWPVLSKRHQAFIRKLIKYKPNFVIECAADGSNHASGGLSAYQEYVHYLNRTMPELTPVEQFALGYNDFLQSPLQPLMDNLESSTYEVFEKDSTKYTLYEKAIHHALLDRTTGSEEMIVIMVVGAGRGPLVTRSLIAAEKAQKRVKVYAIEKNPNAFVTLQNKKAEVWGNKVTIVFSDMRLWKAPEKADILVSELLGSFGDNELSPECLDGAQKFLKSDGISIPTSYTAFISPISSSKIHNEVAAYKDLAHFETPYVVMFQAASELAKPCQIWTFEHPNRNMAADEDGNPINNYHNTRYSKVTFNIRESGILHGIAGYFESILYKDIMLSIHPATHSIDMLSWFPIFFPLRIPIYLPSNTKLDINFWRLTNSHKVWYEWCVDPSIPLGLETISFSPSAIHNSLGRSSWIGL